MGARAMISSRWILASRVYWENSCCCGISRIRLAQPGEGPADTAAVIEAARIPLFATSGLFAPAAARNDLAAVFPAELIGLRPPREVSCGSSLQLAQAYPKFSLILFALTTPRGARASTRGLLWAI